MSPRRQRRQCLGEGSRPHQTRALCSMSATRQSSFWRGYRGEKRHAKILLSEGPANGRNALRTCNRSVAAGSPCQYLSINIPCRY